MSQTSNAPGPSGTPSHVIRIDSACTPRPMDHGVRLACGGTITAVRTVMGQAQLISATTGNPQATGTIQTFTLKPGEKVVLATPPSGYEWWVMDLTPGQAGMIFMSVIGIAVAGTALAGYGLFRVVEDRIAAHRRKRFTKKLSRWFWGQ